MVRSKKIFQERDECLNLVHYNTKSPEDLLMQMVQITDEVGYLLNGFQLNIAWPNPKTLETYHKLCPGKTIVLQVGNQAFAEAFNVPSYLARIVKDYLGLVDYVLLDPSGGLGIPFYPLTMQEYLQELQQFENELGTAVAGGLSPSTLHLLKPLVKEFPGLSINAEGKLRTSMDDLDVAVARQYIEGALKMFAV